MSTPWIVAFVVLWAFSLLTATILLGLLRRVTSVLESVEAAVASALTGPGPGGAPVGTRIPHFEAAADGGRPVSSRELLEEGAVFVLMEAGCGPCQKLAGRLGGVGDRLEGVPFHVVLEDTPEAREFPLPAEVPVLYQHGGAVSRAFDSSATPQAFAVDASGTVVGRTIAGTVDQLRDLARQCRESDGHRTSEGG